MERWAFSREFKLEAVMLVGERGVKIAQAARDLDLHENMHRKWIRDAPADPSQAFSGPGQMKTEQLEIERVAHNGHHTRDQVKADVFDYIERFYDPRRQHATLGYLSFIEFGKKMPLA